MSSNHYLHMEDGDNHLHVNKYFNNKKIVFVLDRIAYFYCDHHHHHHHKIALAVWYCSTKSNYFE